MRWVILAGHEYRHGRFVGSYANESIALDAYDAIKGSYKYVSVYYINEKGLVYLAYQTGVKIPFREVD